MGVKQIENSIVGTVFILLWKGKLEKMVYDAYSRFLLFLYVLFSVALKDSLIHQYKGTLNNLQVMKFMLRK